MQLPHLGRECQITLHEVGYPLATYHLPVDTYALTEVDQMWRRVKSRAVSRRLKYGGKRVGCRTLAVGAGNMYRAEPVMRIAECPGQTPRRIEPRLIGRSALPLIHRQLCV